MSFRFQIETLIAVGELIVEAVEHIVELVKRILVEETLRISICVPPHGFPSIAPPLEMISLWSIPLRMTDTQER
jgi:hypothetical protein